MTDTQLEQIEDMAAALMPPKDIAILLALPPAEYEVFAMKCLSMIETPEYTAYQKGRLTTKLKLRKQIIKLAEHGSPQAEALADKYISNQNF
jgi:hypothetical protein